MRYNKIARRAAWLSSCAWLLAGAAFAGPLHLNDKGYYETPGVNVLVFSNWYDGLFADAKISGVELIHHGERTASNGSFSSERLPITTTRSGASGGA